MSPTLALLESFLALSESIASAAEAQEWDTLVSLGEKRGSLLEGLPADIEIHLPQADQARARSIIERCQQLDDRTCELVEERKKEISILLRGPALIN